MFETFGLRRGYDYIADSRLLRWLAENRWSVSRWRLPSTEAILGATAYALGDDLVDQLQGVLVNDTRDASWLPGDLAFLPLTIAELGNTGLNGAQFLRTIQKYRKQGVVAVDEEAAAGESTPLVADSPERVTGWDVFSKGVGTAASGTAFTALTLALVKSPAAEKNCYTFVVATGLLALARMHPSVKQYLNKEISLTKFVAIASKDVVIDTVACIFLMLGLNKLGPNGVQSAGRNIEISGVLWGIDALKITIENAKGSYDHYVKAQQEAIHAASKVPNMA